MSEQIWFTSDTHFDHAGILKYERGDDFGSTIEMNEYLITNWNDRVTKNDRIYHLGDFSFGNKNAIRDVLGRLNGQIHLIRGNHDRQLDGLASEFASYGDYKEIRVDGQKICMSHFPFLTWNGAHHGSWMLHGHCHGNLAFTRQPRLDVGVDSFDYRPVSFDKVRQIMSERAYTPVDHHVGRDA